MKTLILIAVSLFSLAGIAQEHETAQSIIDQDYKKVVIDNYYYSEEEANAEIEKIQALEPNSTSPILAGFDFSLASNNFLKSEKPYQDEDILASLDKMIATCYKYSNNSTILKLCSSEKNIKAISDKYEKDILEYENDVYDVKIAMLIDIMEVMKANKEKIETLISEKGSSLQGEINLKPELEMENDTIQSNESEVIIETEK